MPCSKPAIMSLSSSNVVFEASLRCMGCKNRSARYFEEEIVDPFHSLHELMTVLIGRKVLPPYDSVDNEWASAFRANTPTFKSWLGLHQECKNNLPDPSDNQYQFVVLLMSRVPRALAGSQPDTA